MTMRERCGSKTIGLQYVAVIMAVFGGLALLLAVVGVYSLMAFVVAQRTHEIGVRIALGATRGDVLRLAVGQTARLTAAGALLGLVLATALGRLMEAGLLGVIASDARLSIGFAAVLVARRARRRLHPRTPRHDDRSDRRAPGGVRRWRPALAGPRNGGVRLQPDRETVASGFSRTKKRCRPAFRFTRSRNGPAEAGSPPVTLCGMRHRPLPHAAAALLLGVLTVTRTAAAAAGATPGTAGEAALVAKARGIHERVITIDTHVDINPTNFAQLSRNYTQRRSAHQVNLPKMRTGGLDAPFLIVYVGQSNPRPRPTRSRRTGYQRAYDQAIEKFEAIHRLTKVLAPDQIELALTAADVRRINAKGKKVALIGVENGYPLGDETTAVRRVQEFYDRGARYMSLAHNGHSQLSDSNTGEREGWKWNGLSPLGKQVIAEMNRVGIMIDVSHPSKASMMQSIELSKAPIIGSHSGVRALCNHSRNMDDEQLLALKKNGGVIQIVAFASYVKEGSTPERTAAQDALQEGIRPAGGHGARRPRVRRRPWRARRRRARAGTGREHPGPAAGPGRGGRGGRTRWRSSATSSAPSSRSGSPRSTRSFRLRRARP